MTEHKFTELIYEYPAVSEKIDTIVTIVKAYITFFKERANMLQEYGKKLHEQSISPMKTGMFSKNISFDDMEDTMKNLLITINTQSDKMAEKYLSNSATINVQIVKPLEKLQKELETGKKRITTDCSKKIKEYDDVVLLVEKAKANYKKIVNEYKQAAEQLNNALANNVQPVNKYIQKKQQATTKLNKAEQDYKKAVENANKTGDGLYKSVLPEHLKSIEALIQKQFDGMRQVLELFVNTYCEIEPITVDVCKEMKEALGALSYENDLKQFIAKNYDQHKAEEVKVELDESIQNENEEKPKEKQDEQPVIEETKQEEEIKQEEEVKEEPKQEEEVKQDEQPVIEEQTTTTTEEKSE